MAAETMKHGGSCPSLETIGAFVDGRFKDREREIVAGHLASCEACYFVFTETARLRAAEPAVATPPRFPLWQIAAGLAAAASLLLAVYAGLIRTPRETAALEQLVAAVGATRPIEARLTGGFAYAPVQVVRAGEPTAVPLPPDARIVVAQLDKEYASNTASRIHGVAALLGGDRDRAIQALEQASRERGQDARVWSDLAAAYLTRAGDAGRALAAANRAIEIDRLLPEALFNRALALDRLALRAEAADAWRAYLTIDDRSGWADEARARLRILTPQP